MSSSSWADERFKALVVSLILDKKPEAAISLLCNHYHLEEPKLHVGVLKGRTKRIRAVYSPRRKEILAANSEYLYDPFTILHEFYHHLRQSGERQRGTEKYADRFASDFVTAFSRVVSAGRSTSLQESEQK